MKKRDAICYLPGIEIYEGYAKLNPNNCAVMERTGDGAPVGPCCFHLENGTTCPRHGKVKAYNERAEGGSLQPDCSTARVCVRIVQIGDWNNYRLTKTDPPIGKDIKRSRHRAVLEAYARQHGWEVVP